MSSIRILQLPAIGSDLFQDTESFLQELEDNEITAVIGGSVISQVTIGRGFIYLSDRSVAASRAGDLQALKGLREKIAEWFDFLEDHPFLSIRWRIPH